MKVVALLLLMLAATVTGQYRARFDSVKVDAKIIIKGSDRTGFFDKLSTANKLTNAGLDLSSVDSVNFNDAAKLFIYTHATTGPVTINNNPDGVTIVTNASSKLEVKDGVGLHETNNKSYTVNDSIVVGGTAITKIYQKGTSPAQEHPRISTGVYAQVLGGLNVKFDPLGDKDARLNLIQGYSADRKNTPHGSQINFATETADGTIKSLFFIGVDYAAPFSDGVYKADSIPPMLIIAGRNTSGTVANDLMSVTGFQYTDGTPPTTRVPGQWGFNSVPGLGANIFTFASRTGMSSSLRLMGLHKVESDSLNDWIHMTKSSSGISKFKFTSTGEMWWYNESGGVAPSTGDGNQLKFLDGGNASQIDWWANSFWFEFYNTFRLIMRQSNFANPTLAINANSTVTGRSLASNKDGLRLNSSVSDSDTDVSIYHQSSSSVNLSSIDFVQDNAANAGHISFSTRFSGGSGERFKIVDSGQLVLTELTTDPSTSHLASNSGLAIYHKNNKIIFAMNIAGTITYLSAPIDGTTSTWTASTTAP